MNPDPFIEKLLARMADLQKTVDAYNAVKQEYGELLTTVDFLKKRFPGDFPMDPETPSQVTLLPPASAGHPLSVLKSVVSGQMIIPVSQIKTILGGSYDEAIAPPVAKPTLSGLAEEILSEGEPLHATDLLIQLRARGWSGSGDDKKDIRNIASTLGLRPKVFYNHGKNKWGLVPKLQSNEEVPQ